MPAGSKLFGQLLDLLIVTSQFLFSLSPLLLLIVIPRSFEVIVTLTEGGEVGLALI